MKATNFLLELPGLPGSWEGQPRPAEKTGAASRKASGSAPRLTLMERLDRWLWRQHVRETEAYLAESRDIYELEERIRRLERSVGARYY